MSRLGNLKRFYAILDELRDRSGGARTLDRLPEFRDWPSRGVYILFEPGEERSDTGEGPRVVRIGTHTLGAGSRSTLRQRLGQHRGTSSGGGNHLGSIFRLLIGQAMLARSSAMKCETWGVKGDLASACAALGFDRHTVMSSEAPVERAVSDYLARLSFLWVAIDDEPGPESLRGFIERNAIALLSNHGRDPVDLPSVKWLGHASDRALVRGSGLWNQRHVNEHSDRDFLDVFATRVEQSG